VLLRLLAALSRGSPVSRAHGSVDRARRAHPCARAHRRRRDRAQGALRAVPRVTEVFADGSVGRARGRQASRGIRAAARRAAAGARLVSWIDLGPLTGLPERGARCVRIGTLAIAVFRTSTGEVFALRDQCPHRGGPLSQGIVHGTRVTCPLHDWVIDLKPGRATGADEGSTATFNVRVVDGRIALELPAEELAKA